MIGYTKNTVPPFPKFTEERLAMSSGRIYRTINLADMSKQAVNRMRSAIKEHLDAVAELEERIDAEMKARSLKGRKDYNFYNLTKIKRGEK